MRIIETGICDWQNRSAVFGLVCTTKTLAVGEERKEFIVLCRMLLLLRQGRDSQCLDHLREG